MSGEIERYDGGPLPPAWRQTEHGIEPIPERWPGPRLADAGSGYMRPDFFRRPDHEPGQDCPNVPHTCLICQPKADQHEPPLAAVPDRSGWPPGPWDTEPDVIRWTLVQTRLACVIARNPRYGHLCGYVAVPAGHPMHGRDTEDLHLAAHWELSYAGDGTYVVPDDAIADSAGAWWIGFHCYHVGDVAPGDPLSVELAAELGGEYRDVEYVGLVCAIVALQVAAAAARHAGRVAQAAFVCPLCGTPSASPDDAANRYCGRCGFTDGTLTKGSP